VKELLEKAEPLYVILEPDNYDQVFVDVETAAGVKVDVPYEKHGLNYRLGPLYQAPQPSAVQQGLELAARFLEKEARDYDDAHGYTEPDTGARVYPGDGDEYVNNLADFADQIRRIAPPPTEQRATTPPPDGDWLWTKLMEWCKGRRVHPADYNDLFSIVSDARGETP